jgi:purine-binding chemotaxis protein CheW
MSESRSHAEHTPDRDWETLARAASRPPPVVESAGALLQLLVIELEGVPYALPVDRVREIVALRPITPVPRVPADVRGVISLRGEIVMVIDARRRLQLPPAPPRRSSRIVLVVGDDGGGAGILVDAVTAVLRVGEDAFRPTAPGEPGVVVSLCRSGDRFVSVIDLERLLDVDAGG